MERECEVGGEEMTYCGSKHTYMSPQDYSDEPFNDVGLLKTHPPSTTTSESHSATQATCSTQ